MIEIYEAADGWRWRIKGKNGEIVATGEAYTRKNSALRGVLDLADLIADDLPITVLPLAK